MSRRGPTTPLAHVVVKILQFGRTNSSNFQSQDQHLINPKGKNGDSNDLTRLHNSSAVMDGVRTNRSDFLLLNNNSETITTTDFPYLRSDDSSRNNEQENSPFHVPNFIQAIVTLILCAILISLTLCIITQLKKFCTRRKSQNLNNSAGNSVNTMLTEVCIANHNNKNTGNGNGNNKVAPVPPSNEAADPGTGSTENYVLTQPGPNLHRSSRNSNGNPNNMRSRSSKCKRMMDPQQPSLVTLKVPGTHFVRRTSGPFGDETLAFVHETYRKPVKPPPSPSPEPGPHISHHYN